jgi:hypothetical protein
MKILRSIQGKTKTAGIRNENLEKKLESKMC